MDTQAQSSGFLVLSDRTSWSAIIWTARACFLKIIDTEFNNFNMKQPKNGSILNHRSSENSEMIRPFPWRNVRHILSKSSSVTMASQIQQAKGMFLLLCKIFRKMNILRKSSERKKYSNHTEEKVRFNEHFCDHKLENCWTYLWKFNYRSILFFRTPPHIDDASGIELCNVQEPKSQVVVPKQAFSVNRLIS